MSRPNNLTLNDSQSWIHLFAITDATAIAGLQVKIVGANGVNYIEGIWTGAANIDLTKYNTTPGFPIGSVIHDFKEKKTRYKTAASTWVASSALS